MAKNRIRDERLSKLAALRELGIEPYGEKVAATGSIADIAPGMITTYEQTYNVVLAAKDIFRRVVRFAYNPGVGSGVGYSRAYSRPHRDLAAL